MSRHLKGKAILNLSGGEDKVVPYAAGEPFVRLLQRVAVQHPDLHITFQDTVFGGVGHQFPIPVLQWSVSWVCDLLAERCGLSSEEKKARVDV